MNKRFTKFILTIAFFCLWICSLCACAAPKTQSPRLPLLASETPLAVATQVKPSPTVASTKVPTQIVIHNENLEIFEEVWSTIFLTFFDLDFGGVDWYAVHARYKPLIIAAADDESLYRLLNKMLWELNVSHTGVGPAEMWPSVEPVVFEDGEIGIDVRLLDDRAVITRVEAASPAEESGLRAGFILQSIEGVSIEQIIADAQGELAPPYNDQGRIDLLTRRLLSLIYGDPGTCVNLAYLDEKDKSYQECIERVPRPREAVLIGGTLPPSYLEFESGRLASGIGYIRFNTFHPDLISDMVEAIDALKDAPGIIIDLRGNPGGYPDAAEELAAQFVVDQVSFGSFKTRSGTIERMVTGKNVYPGPLVILIDALSYSASEYFSSGLQEIGRAVIIGERSPGGVTAMDVKILQNGALLGCPVAQLITSDGKVLEGYGVIPDITVTLERDQLLKGIDAQLQAAIETILENVR